MKTIEYLFGPAFKHIFAIVVLLMTFSMLTWGELSETGKTRMEDFAGMVVAYYFVASVSGSKKDETIEKMVDNQKQLVSNNLTTNNEESLIRSGDPVTVTKE